MIGSVPTTYRRLHDRSRGEGDDAAHRMMHLEWNALGGRTPLFPGRLSAIRKLRYPWVVGMYLLMMPPQCSGRKPARSGRIVSNEHGFA
jgi:hypothetical protein